MNRSLEKRTSADSNRNWFGRSTYTLWICWNIPRFEKFLKQISFGNDMSLFLSKCSSHFFFSEKAVPARQTAQQQQQQREQRRDPSSSSVECPHRRQRAVRPPPAPMLLFGRTEELNGRPTRHHEEQIESCRESSGRSDTRGNRCGHELDVPLTLFPISSSNGFGSMNLVSFSVPSRISLAPFHGVFLFRCS